MSQARSSQESSLLLTLEEISQLVSRSRDPAETLANIVGLIQGRFQTDVCSVYYLEPQRNELVLGATIGLKPESIGCVRMRLDEGLTGLVAEQLAPVMVGDAFAHPRFKYFPEAGEERYHSFLGVPLLEGGALQGVLVVQTREARQFSANETRMLIAVAAQLAPLVSEARLLEQVVAAAHRNIEGCPPATESEAPLRGTGLSPGIGVGQAYLVDGFDHWPVAEVPSAGPAEENHRFRAALAAAHEEITRQSQRISELVGEDHGAILQAQLMIMQDRAIETDVTDCLAAGLTAEDALIQTLNKYVMVFQKVATPFFQERIHDLKDVFRRLLWHLRPRPRFVGAAGDRLVLVAREASVLELFSVDLDRLAAVVVEHGGPQCHAAILARSLGVPMVGQVPDLITRIPPGRQLLVDGGAGVIYPDPSPELAARCQPDHALAAVVGEANTLTEAAPADLPRLEVNINLLAEVRRAVDQFAGGVGLYRSEFLFLARRTFPTEEEQVGVYGKLLGLLRGRPVSIRTFDLRPDKVAHAARLTSAARPFDWRLVLESPPLQKLFKDQVRAILRAAALGPARILVPLITRTEQLDFVMETVEKARAELRRDDLPFGSRVPIGIMIEVAAAAAMVETWAEAVDFFALGTNDLIASALGIDREDPVGACADDLLHPGLLRMIHGVITAAHRAGRRVTVCGEMAADPQGARALAALQVDSLSVPVAQLGAVRRALAERLPAALGAQLLELRTAAAARALLGSA